jgi:tRNA pseudouridine13 synthase
MVDEIPAYKPSGSGSHRYIRVQKTLLTTPELVHLIAKAAGVPEPSIGYAGLKDKHAVTTQWLSVPLPCHPTNEWALPESVEILEEGLHTNKLRTGHLHGNTFKVRLLNLEPEDKARFQLLWARITAGMFNGFGEQRFGYGGANLQKALYWLRGNSALRGPKARFLKKLHPSVIQSEIFNRYLIRRSEASLERPLLGEVVRLKGSGACFIVKDPDVEQPRWSARDILPTGPMLGGRVHPAAEADALTLEDAVAHDLCPEPEQVARLRAEAPGTRRDLLLFLEDPNFEWVNDQTLTISFTLPAGAYATQVLRELTQVPWLQARG